MLSAADLADVDLSGFDLSGLSSGLQSMVVRQDRYRREAVSIGVRPECPETYNLVLAAERDAAVLAELERLVATIRLFAVDESTRRPRAEPAATSSCSGRGLLARAFAALASAPAGPRDTTPTETALRRRLLAETGEAGR